MYTYVRNIRTYARHTCVPQTALEGHGPLPQQEEHELRRQQHGDAHERHGHFWRVEICTTMCKPCALSARVVSVSVIAGSGGPLQGSRRSGRVVRAEYVGRTHGGEEEGVEEQERPHVPAQVPAAAACACVRVGSCRRSGSRRRVREGSGGCEPHTESSRGTQRHTHKNTHTALTHHLRGTRRWTRCTTPSSTFFDVLDMIHCERSASRAVSYKGHKGKIEL